MPAQGFHITIVSAFLEAVIDVSMTAFSDQNDRDQRQWPRALREV